MVYRGVRGFLLDSSYGHPTGASAIYSCSEDGIELEKELADGNTLSDEIDAVWRELESSRKIKVTSKGKVSKMDNAPTAYAITAPSAAQRQADADGSITLFDELWGDGFLGSGDGEVCNNGVCDQDGDTYFASDTPIRQMTSFRYFEFKLFAEKSNHMFKGKLNSMETSFF